MAFDNWRFYLIRSGEYINQMRINSAYFVSDDDIYLLNICNKWNITK